MFDAGISDMAGAVHTAGVRLGGIKRVVLGHADADHRGSAPGLGAPVYCHPASVRAAESYAPLRPYWDFAKLKPHGRALYKRLLPAWDGGAVQIAGTVQEGDEIAGFRVIRPAGARAGSDRAVSRLRSARAGVRLLLHGRPADRDQGRRARAPPGVHHGHRPGARLDPQARRDVAVGRLGRPRGSRPRRRGRAAAARRVRRVIVGRRSRQRAARDKRQAPTSDYRDDEGNVLTLRGSLTPAARREYADVLAGGHDREDAWQRAVELLFERLTVSWTIAGPADQPPEGPAGPLPGGYAGRAPVRA